MAFRALLCVAVGAATTVVSTLLVAVALPLVGLGAAALVGTSLPVWLFALPLLACPVLGGGITGVLQPVELAASALLAALAAALGVLVVGLLSSVGLGIVLLGMTPAHASNTPTFSTVVTDLAPLLAGSGFVVGAVLGAVGGVGGSAIRDRLGA
ncbi:hypothetical protein [Haloarcula onubensis]|uniref:Uncharacterized protein n=1 Tax=Haloarcula onubensis TaxID=2950539 RepID=A0ABU2FNS4_9EURY|nr:hypothetical protein [Halomicroarcula sp. S3CR25-11]MDS0282405.1 hypothetical protein [Halomicroarcula sp. S3CR25-11]